MERREFSLPLFFLVFILTTIVVFLIGAIILRG